jgi:hypothetical protein
MSIVIFNLTKQPPFSLSDPFNGALKRPTQKAISCYEVGQVRV